MKRHSEIMSQRIADLRTTNNLSTTYTRITCIRWTLTSRLCSSDWRFRLIVTKGRKFCCSESYTTRAFFIKRIALILSLIHISEPTRPY